MSYEKYFKPTMHAKFGDDRRQGDGNRKKTTTDFYLSE